MTWNARRLGSLMIGRLAPRGWLLAGPVAAVLLAAPAAHIQAADILVTTNADSGAGSLRAAIDAAASGDRIVFAASLTGGDTITLQSQLLIIDKSLTIDGSANPNLVIDGHSQHRAPSVG